MDNPFIYFIYEETKTHKLNNKGETIVPKIKKN